VKRARRVDAMCVMPRSRRLVAVLLAAIAVAMLAAAARADAFIYWTSAGTLSGPPMGNSIGRANFVNGLNVNNGFITGANNPAGVAVDPNFIYWTNSGAPGNFGTTIGRADIHGPGANQSFITGANVPVGVAVDSAHIYWTNGGTPGTPGTTIGQANINGSGVNQSFITGAADPTGVAVDANFVYWANTGTNTIGRASINGSGANQRFITGATTPAGIAVDSNFIYWVNAGNNTIGRASINGTGANQSFSPAPRSRPGSRPTTISSTGRMKRPTRSGGRTRLMARTSTRASSWARSGHNSWRSTRCCRWGRRHRRRRSPTSWPPVQGLGLPHGIERSLLAQLGAAQEGGACENLRAFMNHVRAQSGKKIAADDAADLLTDAAAARESLGCGGG